MAESDRPEAERRRRHSKKENPDFRMVLVGKTGSGKSSSGNTILGRDAFRVESSNVSVTRQCCKKKGDVFDRTVTLVDTPGLFDTSQPDESVEREISKCINMSAPGPHAILLVIKVGPFTPEERESVKRVKEIFGEEAWKYTIILFTYGDRVKTDFEQVLEQAGPELQEVLKKAGNRHQLFNNNNANNRSQVLELLEKVEEMVQGNGGECYSNYTYEQVVEMMEQRELELSEFYRKKLEEEIKAVELKYEKKLREAQEEKEQVEKRLQSELKELQRYYRALESGVRQVVEQSVPQDSIQGIVQFYKTLKLN